ncbi:zincin-like metallopeptidase domain-containing protein [Faecalibaculum rodentium]|uniref:DUF1738 domain-containing protein n=3 Tax=Faecalibaculum rodentium TaxID=1702221 RepID=A0A1Q9YJD7_9FIRM|nr:zincin-like metallopeptidase domain-containing protein [Faecalibaculum rodentium]OLU44520.1 hypothetical protein BO223_08010 [Faecalibaculum rodentium]
MRLYNNRIRLYEIDKQYASYLRSVDSRVSVKDHRPFVGILVSSGKQWFCIPITTQVVPKSGKARRKDVTTIIFDNHQHPIAAVLYNNMLPVYPEFIHDYEVSDPLLKELSLTELRFLNRLSIRDEIIEKSTSVMLKSKHSMLMRKICVNFPKLTKAAKIYYERQMMIDKKKRADPRQQLVDAYVASLEQGKIPWYKGWTVERPYNIVSKTAYKGLNQLILQLAADQEEYKDPRWMTFKQAKDNGWKVRKGEHGIKLTGWAVFDIEKNKTISLAEFNRRKKEDPDFDKNRYRLFQGRSFVVFNAAQVEGVPEYVRGPIQIKGNELIERLPSQMGVALKHGGDNAFYHPLHDFVRIPDKENFVDDYVYDSTLLHELCHASGHHTRLNRDLTGKFGSESYAKEELRAEIGSSFLMAALQIKPSPAHIRRHAAYIQSWITILKKDPKELEAAVRGAEKIEKYIISVGDWEKELEVTNDGKLKQNETPHKSKSRSSKNNDPER